MTKPEPPPRWRVLVPRLVAPLLLVLGVWNYLQGEVRDLQLLRIIGAAITLLSLVVAIVAVDMWRRERQSR
ncbi:hypothetical protein [Nocardioides lentus]|uniref:hypothetical protein n=1 Tax=Nocardioides lentus TaxID=338077 RepID=UPI0031DE7FEA